MSTTPGGPARRLTVGRIMIWIAGLAAALVVAVPIINNLTRPHVNPRASHCLNNMRQLGLAVQGYINQHGTLPPAYVVDPTGKPLYSWRVLILPYVDRQALYNDFRRDEPWDSPHNIELLGQISYVYKCPSHTHTGKPIAGSDTCTSYFALRGPATAFPGTAPVPIGRITDPLGRTILFAESDQGDVPWSAPVDINMATGRLTWAAPGGPTGPISPHKGGINVVMVDGSARRISMAEFKRSMAPMSTIAGGEAVEIGDR